MKPTILLLVSLLFASTAQAQKDAPSDTTAVKAKKQKPKVKISGMIQVHFLREFNTNGDNVRDPDGFRILRARLQAEGDLNKFISYQLMIDPRSPEHRGLLRDAYVDVHFLKNQTLRVGQQKTQFGYDNPETIREHYVVNRSEMSDNLARGVNLRDAGLGLLGEIPIDSSFRIENSLTFTNGSGLNVAGPFDFSSTKNWFGRLGIRYKKGKTKLYFGVSGGMGGIKDTGDDDLDPADDFFYKFKRLGLDVRMDHPRFFAVAEYARGPDNLPAETEDRVGYYLTVAGKTKWDIGPLVRYDALDDEYKRLTLGAYYGKPKDNFRLLMNYEFRGNIKDIPEGHDDRLYMQMQVVF